MTMEKFMVRLDHATNWDIHSAEIRVIKNKYSGDYKIYYKQNLCFLLEKRYVGKLNKVTYLIDYINSKEYSKDIKKMQLVIIDELLKIYDLQEFRYLKEQID